VLFFFKKMKTSVIITSYLLDDDRMVHNIQSDNKSRIFQMAHTLKDNGYVIIDAFLDNEGFSSITFAALKDKKYSRASSYRHKEILNILRIPIELSMNEKRVKRTEVFVNSIRSRSVRTSPVKMRDTS